MLGWGPFKEGEAQDMGRMLGRPGAPGLLEWARRGKAHHGGQRDALVPLRVGCLLQDLAAELKDTQDRWIEFWGTPDSLGDHLTSWGLFSAMLATLQAGQKRLGASKAQTQGIAETKHNGKSDPRLEGMGWGSKGVWGVRGG